MRSVGQQAPAPAQKKELSAGVKPVDPVCGMMGSAKAAGKSEYKRKTYYFCTAGCKKKFDANPEVFLGEKND